MRRDRVGIADGVEVENGIRQKESSNPTRYRRRRTLSGSRIPYPGTVACLSSLSLSPVPCPCPCPCPMSRGRQPPCTCSALMTASDDPGLVRLTNGIVDVDVSTSYGPRILHYGFVGGRN